MECWWQARVSCGEEHGPRYFTCPTFTLARCCHCAVVLVSVLVWVLRCKYNCCSSSAASLVLQLLIKLSIDTSCPPTAELLRSATNEYVLHCQEPRVLLPCGQTQPCIFQLQIYLVTSAVTLPLSARVCPWYCCTCTWLWHAFISSAWSGTCA